MMANLFKGSRGKFVFISMSIVAVLAVFAVIYQTNPIEVGFAAQLTGRQGELGVQERNGAQLAIDSINDSGGIWGRNLKLVIEDDLGTPEGAQQADLKLIKKGVVAIIGHATTNQSLAGLEVTNPAKVVLLSPTVSTPTLTGIDDYFFRVYPSFKDSAQAFAKYIFFERKIEKMSVVYDVDNLSYAKVYYQTFVEAYKKNGGKIVSETSFSSSAQPDFGMTLARIKNAESRGLLIIASDLDTAIISQRAKGLDWSVDLFASAWAQTKTLIENGGLAVEGLTLEQSYSLSSTAPSFIDFNRRYTERYKTDPSFGAAFAYDAVMVLAEALKDTKGSGKGLKEALTEIKNFKGVDGVFSLDEFGDVKRPFYLSKIVNGNYIVKSELTLQN